MKQPSKKDLLKLKKEVIQNEKWEEVEPFHLTYPTSIRLPANLVHGLQLLADLHGERSYQSLLKRWVSERVKYELELIEQVKDKKMG